MRYVIGVDVGTGSARAGVFDDAGTMYATAQCPIALHQPHAGWAEQSSTDIWKSVCTSVRECLSVSGIDPQAIEGISFSATCSLVLLDTSDQPLLLSEGAQLWDVVVWMDHRAVKEAEQISASGSTVLDNLGGTMSPEMQIPKLMWLKKHRVDLWERLGFAGDLADYLTYRCTGSNDRSVCTLGCKWTYNPDLNQWDHSFLAQVGLEDLLQKGAIPEQAKPIGSVVGSLTSEAAEQLGLSTSCHVATGLIDAHAGALGTLGLFANDDIEKRMALIAGTSNCHITLSHTRQEVPGVWGPYAGAVVPSLWANEGGQSASGAALDQVVALFAAGQQYGDDPHGNISREIQDRLVKDQQFANDVHVLPDFIGNRSPFANPDLRGTITGLTLEDQKETFLKVYWATAASIAYGTRLIIDTLNNNGYQISTIHLSGGHKKSELLVGLYSDATGCDVVLSSFEEPVLLGAAMAALLPTIVDQQMSTLSENLKGEHLIRKPSASTAQYHAQRYKAFLKMYSD